MAETSSSTTDAVVFGATGFLGRWTVLHLLDQGRTVGAVVRDPLRDRIGADGEPAANREGELRAWLQRHGVATGRLAVVAGDLTDGAGLGLSAADDERLAGVRDVFNTAALYRFGLRREEARAVNVEGALNVLHWAATHLPLRRRGNHVRPQRRNPLAGPEVASPASDEPLLGPRAHRS